MDFDSLLPYTRGLIMGIASRLVKSKNKKDIQDGIKIYEEFGIKYNREAKTNLWRLEDIQGLEKKIAAAVFGMLIIAGLFFGSSFTGAVVGLTKASSGFLGITLFIGGILGLFFTLKDK